MLETNLTSDDLNVIDYENERNKYSIDFCIELRNKIKTKSYQQLSVEYNITKGMIAYLVNRND